MNETLYTIDIQKEEKINRECRYLEKRKDKIVCYYTNDTENVIRIAPNYDTTDFEELKEYFAEEDLLLEQDDGGIMPFFIECKKEVSENELNIFLILQKAFDDNRIVNWSYYENHLRVEIDRQGNDEVLEKIRDELKPFTEDLDSRIRYYNICKELVYESRKGWDILKRNSNPIQSYAVTQVYKAIQKKKCYDRMKECWDRIDRI